MDDVNYLDVTSSSGMNLYAYCNNNPIMYCDPNGHVALFLITMGIGAIVGLIIAAVKDYKDDEESNVWSYIGWTLGGAAIGAIVGLATAATLAGHFTASIGNVITGVKTLIEIKETIGLAAFGYAIIDNWDNAINGFTHVFWSGKDLAENGARYLANDVGGKTLEMTRLGQYLSKNFSGDNFNLAAWQAGSRFFANQVIINDTVFFVQNMYEFNMLSTWATIENPILLQKFVEIIKVVFGGR